MTPNLGATRFLDWTYPEIEANLALDEALLVAAENDGGGPVLRVWEPSRLAVVLGASSRLHEDVHVERCHRDDVTIARRSSGGGTVLIGHGTLNATVVLASDGAPGLDRVDTSHGFVLERFAEAIRARGQPVEVRGLGDLALHDRKVAGSAQRRLRRRFLVHLSILYDFRIVMVERYLKSPKRQPEYRAGRPHEAFLTNLTLPRLDLLQALRAAWHADDRMSSADLPRELVNELVATRFGDPAWVARL